MNKFLVIALAFLSGTFIVLGIVQWALGNVGFFFADIGIACILMFGSFYSMSKVRW